MLLFPIDENNHKFLVSHLTGLRPEYIRFDDVGFLLTVSDPDITDQDNSLYNTKFNNYGRSNKLTNFHTIQKSYINLYKL